MNNNDSRYALKNLIEELIKNLRKYAESKNPNPSTVQHKNELIIELTRIYNSLPKSKYSDTFQHIKSELDLIISKHPEIKGVIVIIPLKNTQYDFSKFAFIKL